MIIIMASIVWPKQHIAVTQPLAVSLPAPQTQLVAGGRPPDSIGGGQFHVRANFYYVPIRSGLRSDTFQDTLAKMETRSTRQD